MPQHFPGPRTRELAAIDDRHTMHDHVRNAFRIVMGILERPDITNFRWVEHGNVRHASGL